MDPPPHATPTQTQPAPDSVIRDGDQIQSPDTNMLHYLDESLTPKFQTLTWVFLATCHVKTKSNTMQVILMLAARQGRLPDIIIALLDYGEDPSGCRAGKTLLRNLKSLLVFWQEHYLHKDKDCSTLEKSSLIPFTFWKVFVPFKNSTGC